MVLRAIVFVCYEKDKIKNCNNAQFIFQHQRVFYKIIKKIQNKKKTTRGKYIAYVNQPLPS